MKVEDQLEEQSFAHSSDRSGLTEGGWLMSMLMSLVLKAN